MEEILSVQDLKRVYGRGTAATQALGGVSLSVEQGEFVGIMGPSGSGKTTLLNCIATIDRPTSGSIRVGGQELTGLRGRALTRFRRERLGFIFQDCNLLDTLTAFENIALALAITKAPAGEIEGRVREMAQRLGIEDCLDKYPYQMSGGQQQRCAAARAMVTPAITKIRFPSRRSMPPRASFRQITSPRIPSSGARTLVPAPRTAGTACKAAAARRISASSSGLRGKAITSAGPPMRNDVCRAIGSSKRRSASGKRCAS